MGGFVAVMQKSPEDTRSSASKLINVSVRTTEPNDSQQIFVGCQDKERRFAAEQPVKLERELIDVLEASVYVKRNLVEQSGALHMREVSTKQHRFVVAYL